MLVRPDQPSLLRPLRPPQFRSINQRAIGNYLCCAFYFFLGRLGGSAGRFSDSVDRAAGMGLPRRTGKGRSASRFVATSACLYAIRENLAYAVGVGFSSRLT